jgi:hypothetical protein
MPINRRKVISGAGLAGAGVAIGAGVDRLLIGQSDLRSGPDGPRAEPSAAPAPDAKPNPGIPENWRDITSGWTIPYEDYADQPYVVKADDGAWVCVITTSGGDEGATSQHVVATRSTDFGRTWSPLIAIEPAGPPESSYATVLKTRRARRSRGRSRRSCSMTKTWPSA